MNTIKVDEIVNQAKYWVECSKKFMIGVNYMIIESQNYIKGDLKNEKTI